MRLQSVSDWRCESGNSDASILSPLLPSPLFLFLWVGLSGVIGFIARTKGRSAFWFFVIALIWIPLIAGSVKLTVFLWRMWHEFREFH
jgi:hypothetical protein